MRYGKTELIRRISDIVRNGWNNNAIRDLIESLWRDPYSMRTSGFVKEGGTDSMIAADVTSTVINGVSMYAIVFTITPKTRKFDFYQFREILTYHKKYHSESIAFDAEEGLHAVYYDFDDDTFEQVLMHIHNPSHDDLQELMQWVVPITFLYYNATTHEIIYFGNNRHGSWWNPWMHFAWHQSFNSMRESGLEFTDIIADGDGSSDTHAQFGVSAGSCFHEDICASSLSQASPADFPVWYFIAGNKPRIHDNSANSLVVDGLLCYNSAGSVLPATDGWFVMVHIFFSNDILKPFLSVMGQAQYEKVSTATLMMSSEIQQVRDKLPHQNLLHIGTLIFQTSALFLNSYHSRIVSQAWGVKTIMSVTGDGSATTPVKLVNDQMNPGSLKYYGTGEDGIKGYHDLPVANLPIEDIGFDWNDVQTGATQTYIVVLKASYAFKIVSVVFQSDSTMDDVTVHINGSPITWNDESVSIDVTTAITEKAAKTDWDNNVAVGGKVTVVTSGIDALAEVLRGALRTIRV